MLIHLLGVGKTIGSKQLYDNLNLTIQPHEKVGLIGRNGTGKTTLLHILDGTDPDYTGQIDRRRGLIIASTAQEHIGLGEVSTLAYVLAGLPEYAALRLIIDTYPETMGDDMTRIATYTDALGRYGELGYYDIEERARAELTAFGITENLWTLPMVHLSGGQKRMVELVKVTLSDSDLALIDEPTNHMDYAAKAVFTAWLASVKQSVVVITHDRDVLSGVDRIIELKSQEALSFPGNYDAYLQQNGAATARAIDTYEHGQKRLLKLDKQIREARARKAGWSGTADKTNPFMLLERRLSKERDELTASLQRPDFWIDQETIEGMRDNVVAKYDTYKSRNIRLQTGGQHRMRGLVHIDNLSLSYTVEPLFKPVSFDLAVGDRLQLHGLNGVGKSTIVKAILTMASGYPLTSQVCSGLIELDLKLVIGTYEQEIEDRYMEVTLHNAVTQLYEDHGLPITDQLVKQILSDYLFDPVMDGRLELRRLSGGQKARFQLIAMLTHAPNLLILDEPTNHLDLPSIEELEMALGRYTGAVLFISHDTYFARNIGGEVIDVIAAPKNAA